ncbi:hypothetical protein KUTeg_024636 [Tegillarca granosa]|uniref:Cytochrome P450 n=1 Tax=Tegillarca granosa TaxID=220873 RepID=A0ABQ9E3M8_TEGGR|nr:hypothetical protein KUTeg_024636 [Tegillarca granosa]
MALYPDEQRKIQRDIDEVIGQRKILRLRTLLPLGLPHATIKDTTLGGYCIPAGTVVIANLYAVSRDESVWENPDEFKPSRFIKENGEIDNEKAEYKLSFGAGRRRCMGEFFAKEALFLIFTTILQQCRIERIPGIKYDLEGKLGISLRPSEYKMAKL